MAKQQTQYFCYLLIKQQSQAIIIFFILAITIILTILIFKQLKQSIAILTTIEKHVQIVYYVIFAWSFFFIAKIILGQVLYWTQKDTDQWYDDYSFILSGKTKWLFALDLIGGFLIQTILFMVPFTWMNKIVQFFKSFYQEDSLMINNGQTQPYLKYEITTLKILKFYLFIRPIIFLSLLITILFLSQTSYEIGVLGEIILFMLIVQGALVIFVLISGICGLKTNHKLAELVDQDDIDLMLNQYVFLIICSAFRFGLDIAFLAIHFEKMRESKCSANLPQTSFWNWVRIVDMIVQAIFTHFLPIFVTLRLFKLDKSQINTGTSLLGSTTKVSFSV